MKVTTITRTLAMVVATFSLAACQTLTEQIGVLFGPSVDFVQPPERGQIRGYQAVQVRYDSQSTALVQRSVAALTDAKIGFDPLFLKVSTTPPDKSELKAMKWATLTVERLRSERSQENDTVKRVKCKDDKFFCKDEDVVSRRNVTCTTRSVAVTADMSWADTASKRSLFSSSFTESASSRVCSDEQSKLPSYDELQSDAIQNVFKKSIPTFLPGMKKRPLELVEQEPGASAEMNVALKQGMEQAKAGKLQFVEEVFLAAYGEGENGFALLFNLGLLNQIKGEYAVAQQYYDLARAKATPAYTERLVKYSGEVNSLVSSGVPKAWGM